MMRNLSLRQIIFPEFGGGAGCYDAFSTSDAFGGRGGRLGEPGYDGRIPDQSRPPDWTPDPAAWDPYSDRKKYPFGDPFYSALNIAARQTQQPWTIESPRPAWQVGMVAQAKIPFATDVTYSNPPDFTNSEQIQPASVLTGAIVIDRVQSSDGNWYAHFRISLDGVPKDAYFNDRAHPDQVFLVAVPELADAGPPGGPRIDQPPDRPVTPPGPRQPVKPPPVPPASEISPPLAPSPNGLGAATIPPPRRPQPSNASLDESKLAPAPPNAAPPPPVTGSTNDALYVNPFWWRVYVRGWEEAQKASPDWGTVALGIIASPLAHLEEGLVRPILNTPHRVLNNAITAGQHLGRSSLWVEQGEWAEAYADYLDAFILLSLAFLEVGAVLEPLGSKGAPAPSGSLPREIPASVPPQLKSALPAERFSAEASPLPEGRPTFGNLGGPQPGEFRGVLQKTGDVYHLEGSTEPLIGQHDFVVKDGQVLVGEGHGFLADGERVTWAGELKFANDGSGVLENYSNVSGHIRAQAGFVGNIRSPLLSGVPFVPPRYFPIGAGLPQLPVIQ